MRAAELISVLALGHGPFFFLGQAVKSFRNGQQHFFLFAYAERFGFSASFLCTFTIILYPVQSAVLFQGVPSV
jgi:hypothetical protein